MLVSALDITTMIRPMQFTIKLPQNLMISNINLSYHFSKLKEEENKKLLQD